MMITRAQINYRAMVVVLPAGTVIGIMLHLAGARWVLLFVAVVTVLLCLQFRRDGVDGAAASVPSFPVQVQQRGTTIMTPSIATAASVPAVPVQVQQRGTTTTTPSVAAALPREAQTAGLRGLGSSASVVAVLPVYTWSKKAGDDCECAICLGEVRRGQVVKQLPACTHLFHTWCIDKWLTSHATCPVCRTPVDFSAAALHGVGSHHSNPLTARGTAQR